MCIHICISSVYIYIYLVYKVCTVNISTWHMHGRYNYFLAAMDMDNPYFSQQNPVKLWPLTVMTGIMTPITQVSYHCKSIYNRERPKNSRSSIAG